MSKSGSSRRQLFTMRPNETHYAVVGTSLSLGLVFFLILILPDLLMGHWLHRECIVTESAIVPEYCCDVKCSSCNEVFPNSPVCNTLIERTHHEKNLTRCLAGDKKACAKEGKFCDNGGYCCDWGYSIPGNPNSSWICYRYVNHRACRLYCPTCYTSRIAYTYEKWCSDGICRNMTVYKVNNHGRNKDSATKAIADEPLGCRKECWVNPNNSQEIRFKGGMRWWAVALVTIIWLPAAIVVLLFVVSWSVKLFEYLMEKFVDWSFTNEMNNAERETLERPILGRWNERDDGETDATGRTDDPPPKYELTV